MTRSQPTTLRLQVFDSLTAGSEARALWSDLLARSTEPSVFSLPGWLDAWHKTIGNSQRMAVIVASRNQLPVLAAAFVLAHSKIKFAGAGPTDYSQLLIDQDFARSKQLHTGIDQLFDAAKVEFTSARWFQLGRIPESSATFAALTSSASRHQAVASTNVTTPHMRMSLAAAAVKKKSLRRHENKLKRRGPLEALTHTQADHALKLLPAFFDQHKRRWAEEGIQSQYEHAEQRQFVQRCVAELAEVNALRFTEVRSAGDAVAFHFGFFSGGIYTWYKPTFNPEFRQFSPGEVLLKSLIEKAVEENAEVFDFTIGNEDFKKRFADQYPVATYLNISDSRILRSLFQAKSALRRLGH